MLKFYLLEDVVSTYCEWQLGVEMVGMLQLFSYCLTILYVVVVCDGCIILDGILGIQNIVVLIFSVTEVTDVVVNWIADDFWGSEYELTGVFSDKVESWYWLCLYIRPMSFPMTNIKTNNIK